jgi:hypothetical protein
MAPAPMPPPSLACANACQPAAVNRTCSPIHGLALPRAASGASCTESREVPPARLVHGATAGALDAMFHVRDALFDIAEPDTLESPASSSHVAGTFALRGPQKLRVAARKNIRVAASFDHACVNRPICGK